MNRQLTIKEIAPYLNYELNMYCGKLMDTYLIYPILGLANNEFYTYVNGEDDSMGRIWMDIEQYKAKPTLYPLSSLTKEITHKGETLIVADIIFPKSDYKNEFDRSISIGALQLANAIKHACTYYAEVEVLFKYHFDVFDLISDGLAIDKTTL